MASKLKEPNERATRYPLEDIPPEVRIVRKRHPFFGKSLQVFG